MISWAITIIRPMKWEFVEPIKKLYINKTIISDVNVSLVVNITISIQKGCHEGQGHTSIILIAGQTNL